LIKKVLLLAVVGGCASAAHALEKIPEEPGFSGFVNVGAGVVSAESNMIAGNDFGDVGKDTIDSLFDSPDSESDAIPVLNFELAYTFTNTRTQVYAGNLLEDFLRFDFSTLLGVRHEFADDSIVALSYVFTGFPTDVWADPYVVNRKREETDRTSRGGRLTWDRILGSRLQLEYTYRDIEIDDELSGRTQLGLTAEQAELLSREGDHHRAEVLYVFNIGENQTLVPALLYGNYDLDGEAMSHDRYSVQLTHTYHRDRFRLLTNVFFGTAEYDEDNPIYLEERDDDRYGLSFTTFHHEIFGLKDWTGVVNIAGYIEDSNIDFYDTQMLLFTLSGLYRF